MPGKQSYRVQVLDRAFAILNTFTVVGPVVGVAELSERLKLHKSTVFRLLKVLEQNQYLERIEEDGKYRLGSKILDLGMRALADVDVAEAGQPCLEKLVAITGETAHLGVLRNGQIISVAVAHGSRNLRMGVSIGGNSPPYCTALGKAILAFLSSDERRYVINNIQLAPYTSNTITEKSEFIKELSRIRAKGYSIDNEEFENGLKCIGAPVRNYSGKVVAAISVAGPVFRMKKQNITRLSSTVMQAARGLSHDLGFRTPSDR